MTYESALAALAEAQQRLSASGYQDQQALLDLRQAERRLAAERGEPWAEELGLPAAWNTGAPLPHVISSGGRTDLICFGSDPDPHFDGTLATSISPGDDHTRPLLQLTFHSCYSIKFGGPNDESLDGHPLAGHGLVPYEAHVVHNSPWIDEEERIASIHPSHQIGWLSHDLTHYLLAFHDETFEALAGRLEVRTGRGTMTSWLHDAVSAAVQS